MTDWGDEGQLQHSSWSNRQTGRKADIILYFLVGGDNLLENKQTNKQVFDGRAKTNPAMNHTGWL